MTLIDEMSIGVFCCTKFFSPAGKYMFQLPVKKITVLKRVQKVWRVRQRAWQTNGALGKTPKLHQTVEDVIGKGLLHSDIQKELADADRQ